jgi:RluA family pseudouridine synthase
MKRKLDWRLKSQGCEILFEDTSLLVLNKPSGLLVLPDRFDKRIPNLFEILREQLSRVYVVHRLDKETSGVIVFAKSSSAHRGLNSQFEDRAMKKVYHAIVIGRPSDERWVVNVPLGGMSNPGVVRVDRKRGKEAVTEFRLVKRFDGFAFVEARPETGRTHQIRVHLQYVGLPILGDEVYGGGSAFFLSQVKERYRTEEEEKPLLSRVALHAESLTVVHPQTGERLTVAAALPKDMRSVLRYLEKFRPVGLFREKRR